MYFDIKSFYNTIFKLVGYVFNELHNFINFSRVTDLFFLSHIYFETNLL